jgi:hypothetical protein
MKEVLNNGSLLRRLQSRNRSGPREPFEEIIEAEGIRAVFGKTAKLTGSCW